MHRTVSRLLHCFGEGDPAVGGFRKISRPQPMRREFRRVESSHLGPLFDERIDRARLQRPLRDIAPTIDLPKNTPALDLSCRKPGGERINGPARQINDLVVLRAGCLGAAQMDGERGEGHPRRQWALRLSAALCAKRQSHCDGDRPRQKQPSGSPDRGYPEGCWCRRLRAALQGRRR